MNVNASVYRRLVVSALALVVLGLVPMSATAQPEQPAPMVGEIVVNRYVCESGFIEFGVPVTDLPLSPSLGSFDFSTVANYEDGSRHSPRIGQLVPSVEAESFTGTLYFSDRFPLSHPESSASGPITSIEITAYVGYSIATGATDTSSLTYVTECDTSSNDLVQRLVAVLVAILLSILNS